MTRDQAITTIAAWWADIMIAQVWNNGDPCSEATHAFWRQTMPMPTDADRAALVAALASACTALDWSPGQHKDWYCDYAADWLDAVLHSVNPTWDSRFCGPQKAGTKYEIDENGTVSVLAKRGYAEPWLPLVPIATG